MGDTFSNTVHKARIFAVAIEVPISRKSARITTPPAHEALQMIEDDSSLHKRMDKLEDMIRSLQDPSVKCVTGRQPQQQFQTSRPKGEVQNRNQQPGQSKKNSKRQFVQPFNASADVQQGRTRQTATSPYLGDRVPQDNRPSSEGYGNPNQNLVGAGASGGNFPQRPPGVSPGVCWVCHDVIPDSMMMMCNDLMCT